MTSAQIRQSFLDFFKSKGHTIVPSSSLLPDSPNLLFTNAGMNQFVPIFLGQRAPDVSKWPGAISGKDTRAADTQKCIRAGGKHNDLEDVGLDTYHHTFFEMLGNWSFGDYFKKEAIEWAWELITEVWKFPKERLYATVYSPDKSKGDPSEFDQEVHDFWAEKFRAASLDPKGHIVNGNKKDNFWMMGDTGPCGPCSEIHVDLTPKGDTKGALVNKGDARCIEIWNLVFIQFNANPDGTFSPLPAKHVDTGMGFERVTSIIQCTRNFTDFNRIISNYETDVFRPIFDRLETLSGKKYGSTLPPAGTTGTNEQEKLDVAFRVIADHIRTLSFAIADGIQPGNNDRNYVLRRILRRAVRYGRTLGFHQPFFYKLTGILAETVGQVFPELRSRQNQVEEVIQREEEAFNKTLDRGIELFEEFFEGIGKLTTKARELERKLPRVRDRINKLPDAKPTQSNRLARLNTEVRAELDEILENPTALAIPILKAVAPIFRLITKAAKEDDSDENFNGLIKNYEQEIVKAQGELLKIAQAPPQFSGLAAFELYDTYGFPLDLTRLMARERNLTVDEPGFETLMDAQKQRARSAQKKQVIELSQAETSTPTRYVGYEQLESTAKVLEVLSIKDRTAVILDTSPLYAEMGGQVGDTGEIVGEAGRSVIQSTQKTGNTWLHFLSGGDAPGAGETVVARVDKARRFNIQRHHTVTHVLHWALHEVVNKEATQKGSYVGPEKLTFDFNGAALSAQQIADIEKLVNERLLENAPVSWSEVPYASVKGRPNIMQFFGDKYGDTVRVVQIGGKAGALDGYSIELCGGTHTRATGEIGLFRIVAESAIAAGVRRIEAVAGLQAYQQISEQAQLLKTVAGKLNAPVTELEKKIESLLNQQKEFEKQSKAAQQKQSAELARALLAKSQKVGAVNAIIENIESSDGDSLQSIADALKGSFNGVVVLGSASQGAVSLVATVSADLVKQVQAGKIIQMIAPIVGGKGGGRPENARGGGKEVTKLGEALARARAFVSQGA